MEVIYLLIKISTAITGLQNSDVCFVNVHLISDKFARTRHCQLVYNSLDFRNLTFPDYCNGLLNNISKQDPFEQNLFN